MKNVVFLFLTMTMFSCTTESLNTPFVTIPSCVLPEVSTDTISSEGIFLSGDQTEGFARGMKLNKYFEGSVKVVKNKSLIIIYKDTSILTDIATFWPKYFDTALLVNNSQYFQYMIQKRIYAIL